MLAVVVFSAICVWIRGATFNIISEKIAKQLRYDLFYFLINKDVSFFDEIKTGDILSRMSSDTEVVQNGLSTNISMFSRSLIFIIASIIILCIISVKLTLVTLVGIIPISLLAITVGGKLRALAKELQQKKADLGQVAEEALANVRTVKAFSCEGFEAKKHLSKNEEVYEVG